MNKIYKILTMAFILFLGSLMPAYAQNVTGVYSYSCDFEDPDEVRNWNLRVGTRAESLLNKWYVDTAINNGGKYALYVSNTQGKTISYEPSANTILASRTLMLNYTGEDYILSFDWIANGYKEVKDGLYVAWVPFVDYYGDSIKIESVNSSVLDENNLKPYCLEVAPTAVDADDRLALRNKSTWQTCQVKIPKGRTNAPYRLVFIWKNGAVLADPGACIDNISIMDGRACAAPKSLRITTSGSNSLKLSWIGDAEKYEVGCYSYEQKSWQIHTVDTIGYIFTDVPEGFCDFYVRTVCWDTLNQETYYSGKAMDNQFIYYPDNHCIDYITMSDENCYISTIKTQYVTEDYGYVRQMVDDGSDSKMSRHTHHYSKTETDPRTGGHLKTVPEGEIASVRLGNWNNGGESERVEFKFVVDSTMPILILKYAVVLESPGHDAKKNPGDKNLQDPRFKLQILDGGKSIGDCASADFTSSWVETGWVRDTLDKTITDLDRTLYVVWKDWTTIGVNLSDYMGKTLTIQLTTYDCSMTVHFGYAYFTLGCDKADLDGEACDGSSITEFRAPSGFDYKWYYADDPLQKTLSTEQTYTLTDSMDTREYAVDVIFKEKPDCSFTLYASSKPHYPVGDFSYKISRRDCRNYITFTNNSRMEQIERHRDGTPNDTIVSKPDAILWDFGKYNNLVKNLSQYKLDEMEFPQAGDTFQVSVRATVQNCDSIFTQTIYLPAIGTTYTDNFYIGCKGYPYTYKGTNPDGTDFVGKTYYESGDYNDTIISSIGCDSIIVTHLLMQDTLFSDLDTVIMSDRPLMFNDTLRDKSGTYVHATKSVQGCDSISTLKLYVHEYLIVDMPAVDSICANDNTWSVPFAIKQGRGYKYSVLWQTDNMEEILEQPVPRSLIDVGVLQPIRPDIYPAMIIFHDSMRIHYPQDIFDDTLHLSLKVLYPDTILTQRWNDVLSVRNTDYNGGFDLIAFQWYKNGQPISGATDSYYYNPEGLDMNAEYAALVTRSGDSLQLMTCPIIPTLISTTDVPNVPTLVERGQRMPVIGHKAASMNGTARWTNIYGMTIDEQTIAHGEGITAPHWAGVYLLTIRDEDANRYTFSVIVQ